MYIIFQMAGNARGEYFRHNISAICFSESLAREWIERSDEIWEKYGIEIMRSTGGPKPEYRIFKVEGQFIS